MSLIARIILWGILMLMLKDANSQPQVKSNEDVSATTSIVKR